MSTRPEREVEPAVWLLGSARDAAQARADWKAQGVAVFECGLTWTAVRIPSVLVYAAAGTEVPAEVGAYLAAVLGGPVFVHPRGRQHYVLTAARTVRSWDEPDAECLAVGTYLGVPAPERAEFNPDYDAYWVVPLSAAPGLCAAGDIARLVATGRVAHKAAKEGGSRG